MKNLSGLGVALITPFTKNATAVDYTALENLLKNLNSYVDFFVVNGTTAESALLSLKERQQILDFVAAHNPDKKPIVYGLGGYNTEALINTFRAMDLSAVCAILSVSPQYVCPTQAGIVRHFTALADAFTLPVLLYNVPGRTASNLQSQTTLQLARHPNIIGIKEASGNMGQCMEIAAGKPEDFLLISGDDLLALPIIAAGGVGLISVIANALPKALHTAIQYALSGDFQTARAHYFPLLKLNRLLFEEGNPAGIKTLCAAKKLCNPTVRLPLVQGSKTLAQKIETALQKLTN